MDGVRHSGSRFQYGGGAETAFLRWGGYGDGDSAGEGQRTASLGSLSRTSFSRILASRKSRGSRLSARMICDSMTRSLDHRSSAKCSTLSRRIITSWRCRSSRRHRRSQAAAAGPFRCAAAGAFVRRQSGKSQKAESRRQGTPVPRREG